MDVPKPCLLIPRLSAMGDAFLRSQLSSEVTTGMDVMVLEEFFEDPPIYENKGDNNHVNEWGRMAYVRMLAASTGGCALRPEGIKEGTLADFLYGRLDRAGFPIVPRTSMIDKARAETWTALPVLREVECVGSPIPRVVVVEERRKKTGAGAFLSRNNFWLLQSLRLLGYDEMSVLLTNAETSDKTPNLGLAKLYDATAHYQPHWIALGAGASKFLDELKIRHFKGRDPAWHLRFSSKDGVGGYSQVFKDSGLPTGPFFEVLFPKVTTKESNWELPPSYAQTLKFDELRTKTISLPKLPINTVTRERLEKARRLYVMEGKSLPDVAKEAGVRVEKVNEAYEDQQWEAERTKYMDRAREKAYEDASRAEAKAAAQAKRMTWAIGNLGLNSIVTRMQAGTLTLSMGDTTKALQMALALSEFTPPGGDAEIEKLRAMPLTQLAQTLNDTLRGMFGDIPGLPERQIEGIVVSSKPAEVKK